LIVFFILIGELFVYTATRIDCAQTGYRISRAKEMQKELKSYGKELNIEHDRLCTPERISLIARTRLNLGRPSPDQVIYLGRAGVNQRVDNTSILESDIKEE